MKGFSELARDYEARHFPPTRRLDLQGEGPRGGRERALRWIQMWAHEEPGAELLLVLERGLRPGRTPGATAVAVETMLEELAGGLIEWWQAFTPGTVALRIAAEPRMQHPPKPRVDPGEGRTPETAGAAPLPPEQDIPPELLPVALRAAELRRTRETVSLGLFPVMLRRVWIEAQAAAMQEGTDWEVALQKILREEERLAYRDE